MLQSVYLCNSKVYQSDKSISSDTNLKLFDRVAQFQTANQSVNTGMKYLLKSLMWLPICLGARRQSRDSHEPPIVCHLELNRVKWDWYWRLRNTFVCRKSGQCSDLDCQHICRKSLSTDWLYTQQPTSFFWPRARPSHYGSLLWQEYSRTEDNCCLAARYANTSCMKIDASHTRIQGLSSRGLLYITTDEQGRMSIWCIQDRDQPCWSIILVHKMLREQFCTTNACDRCWAWLELAFSGDCLADDKKMMTGCPDLGSKQHIRSCFEKHSAGRDVRQAKVLVSVDGKQMKNARSTKPSVKNIQLQVSNLARSESGDRLFQRDSHNAMIKQTVACSDTLTHTHEVTPA